MDAGRAPAAARPPAAVPRLEAGTPPRHAGFAAPARGAGVRDARRLRHGETRHVAAPGPLPGVARPSSARSAASGRRLQAWARLVVPGPSPGARHRAVDP